MDVWYLGPYRCGICRATNSVKGKEFTINAVWNPSCPAHRSSLIELCSRTLIRFVLMLANRQTHNAAFDFSWSAHLFLMLNLAFQFASAVSGYIQVFKRSHDNGV